MCTRPGWELLADLTGLSKSTVKRALRRLRDWGLLGVVETGSTWRTRGFQRGDDKTNRGAVYVLCVPAGHEPVEISDPPSRRELEEPHTHARTRENTTPQPTTNLWPISEAPQTRRDQLNASKRLLELPVFRDHNARYVRSIFRSVYEAGWSPAQIRHALDHTPAGVAYWHTEQVRHPAAWAKNRLNAWRHEDGTWITPPVKLGAGRTTDLTAADVAALPRPADTQPTANVTGHANAARQALAAVRARLTGRKPQQRVGLGVNLPDADGRQAVALEPQAALEPATGHGDDWLLRNAAAARQDAGRWDIRGIA